VAQKFFSLSAVTRRLAELLEPALSKTFWVKAEISSGTERGGAFYCDLVESDAEGRVQAQMRCTLWPRELARIRAKFAAAGLELQLADGCVVGMECRVQFHARYGLSLSGIDMDPAVALGELELRRRRILERLTSEGLLDRNAELPVPLLANRIALITSAVSAACADFVETLNASGFGFRIYLADAAVQGVEAEAQILGGLEAAARLSVDLVVITRGGGTRTDLAWLDNEAIARSIAAMPIPVWTGIGHEVDRGVLDVVAARAFKTPTGVAEELVARFSGVEALIGSAQRQLTSFWQVRHDHERHYLRHASTGLRQGSRKLLELRAATLRALASEMRSRLAASLSTRRSQLAAARAAMRGAAEGRLVRAAYQLRDVLRRRFRPVLALRHVEAERAALRQRLRALRAADPDAALARGFSLTYTAEGELVRSVDDLRAGQATLTRLADGQLESVVRKILEGKHG
jgi:exodeoxyribonuclease VII large subunit